MPIVSENEPNPRKEKPIHLPCRGPSYGLVKAELTTSDIAFTRAVERELLKARKKFPSNLHQLAALTEENGELAQALIDHDMGKQTHTDIYKEAVQVAAMAMRLATEGSAEFKYDPGAVEQEF